MPKLYLFAAAALAAVWAILPAAAQDQAENTPALNPAVEEAPPADATPIEAPAGSAGLAEEAAEAEEMAAQETWSQEADMLPPVLDLDTAKKVALRDNPSLKAAQERVEQAWARLRQAQSAYYPQVGASYSASHTELSPDEVEANRDAAFRAPIQGLGQGLLSGVASGIGGAGGVVGGGFTSSPASLAFSLGQTVFSAYRARDAVPDDVQAYSASLSASYLVFNGFARKFNVAIARYGAQSSEAGSLEAQRLILDAVAQSFYGVQLARENIAIAEADVSFNERQLREAEARRRVGTGALSDVLNFEVRVRAARSAMLDGERNWRQARIVLAALMGIPEAKLPETVELIPLEAERPEEMVRPAEEEPIDFALAHRPDLHQLRFGIEQAEAGVGVAKSEYYPDVSAFVAADANQSDDSRFNTGDFSTTVGVNVGYDIYTGGRRKAQVREARSAVSAAEQELYNAELNAISEVRQALVNLATAQDQLVLQRTTAEYVERNRDLVEKEYRAGQAALARLNQAQRDLIEAQGRLALARVALRQAWHDLRITTAETLTIAHAGLPPMMAPGAADEEADSNEAPIADDVEVEAAEAEEADLSPMVVEAVDADTAESIQ